MLERLGWDLLDTLAFMKKVPSGSVTLLGSSIDSPQFVSSEAESNYGRIRSNVRGLAHALANEQIAAVVGKPSGLIGAIADSARSDSVIYACDRAREGAVAHAHSSIRVENHHFARYDFSQKVALMKHTAGGIFAPGGIGTFDSLCEMQNLIMCRKSKNHFPIVLFDSQFWQGFLNVLHEIPNRMAAQSIKGNGYLTQAEIRNIRVTDDPEEAARLLRSGPS